jgi:hypothetical protein
MFGRLFPKQIDNAYRGHWLAIVLLVLVLLMKLVICYQAVINTQLAAQTADAIPLGSFGAAGASAVLTLFKLWGWDNFLLDLLGVGVLLRYRALIPFIYLLQLAEQLGRKALLLAFPITSGSSPLPFNIGHALLALLLIGFVLSLLDRRGNKLKTAV